MLRRVSLTTKMLILTLLVGSATWTILDSVQTRSIGRIFNDQLLRELALQAQEDRLEFDHFVKTHSEAVRLFTAQKRFNDYLDEAEASGWNSGDRPPKIYTKRPPMWYPRLSVARAFMQARFAFLIGPEGKVQEVFQTGPEPPPEGLMSPTALLRELSHNQSYMTSIGDTPFLIASESVTGPDGGVRATLLLATPLDDETLFETFGMVPHERITALLDSGGLAVIASSRPELIPAGTTIEGLSGKYLMAGKSFFDYGSSELRLQFSSFITRDRVEELTGAVLKKERRQRALTALALVASFTLIMLWITGNINLLTSRVSDFSSNVLGIKTHRPAGGDQLVALSEEFDMLTEEVISARAALQREAEEKVLLERQASQARQKERDNEILMQVMEILGVGVIGQGHAGPVAVNPVMEMFAEECGGISNFMLEEGLGKDERYIADCHGEARYFNLSRFYSPGGEESYLLVHDLTEAKRAEQSLRASELRFREMMDNIQLVAVMLDLEGNLTYCNDYLLELTGWDMEDVAGKNWFETFIPEDERGGLREMFTRMVSKGEFAPHHENMIVARDGQARTVFWNNTLERDVDGNPVGTNSIGVDVTELRHAEQTLRDSEGRARAITDAATDAIILIDDLGRVTYWNPAAERIFGYTVKEAMGSDVHELLTPEKYLPAAREGFERFTRTGEGPALGITRVLSALRKGGAEFPVELSLSAFESKGRRVAVGVVRDITERVKAEKDKDAMFHMMTHDIKGPLSIIYGYGELLNMQLKDPSNLDMVADMQKAASRISSLIDDMLALSRMESGRAALRLEGVTVRDLVDLAVEDSRMNAQKMEVSIETDVPEDLPRMALDKKQMGRAVENLVLNAVNYNRHGGRVLIRAGIADVKGASDVRVYIEVSDTGLGIPPEDLPHVFDKYYRSKKTGARKGTGLGLAIVKAAVEAHGGGVSVTSVEGRGTTFRVELPTRPSEEPSQQDGAQDA